MEFILQPWPWYVSGALIAFIMFLLLIFGKNFGMSANLRTMCAVGGAGKFSDFFKFDWRSQRWNLVFVLGTILGGTVSVLFLMENQEIDLNPATIESLKELGINFTNDSYLPQEIFGIEQLTSFKGLVILLVGGFLVGFGSRYAGGCTSGHAISGLSDLQIPSLIAVVGFFIGGIIMTYLIMPLIFG